MNPGLQGGTPPAAKLGFQPQTRRAGDNRASSAGDSPAERLAPLFRRTYAGTQALVTGFNALLFKAPAHRRSGTTCRDPRLRDRNKPSQPRDQAFERQGAVARLRARIRHRHCDSRRLMDHAHRRLRLVQVLSAGSARPERLNPDLAPHDLRIERKGRPLRLPGRAPTGRFPLRWRSGVLHGGCWLVSCYNSGLRWPGSVFRGPKYRQQGRGSLRTRPANPWFGVARSSMRHPMVLLRKSQ